MARRLDVFQRAVKKQGAKLKDPNVKNIDECPVCKEKYAADFKKAYAERQKGGK